MSKILEYIVMIDLIIEIYKVSNPIIISELIEKEFQTEVSIFQIMDYLEINQEDWIKESNKIKYYENNY
jgi:hypothetical protein